MRLYLCGPINGCTDGEAKDWRAQVKNCPFVEPIDPMKRDYRGREQDSYREIVDLDKLDIRNADALIVRYVKPSVGTSMEILYAWTLQKPIVVWVDTDTPLSPWLRYHSTACVNSLQEALDKLQDWFS
jgi:hypothetical protein